MDRNTTLSGLLTLLWLGLAGGIRLAFPDMIVPFEWALAFAAVCLIGIVATLGFAVFPRRKPAPSSPFQVADVLFVDWVPVTDEWHVASTPLVAINLALQVTNGGATGATLRGAQAHAENEWGDRVALSFLRGDSYVQQIDLRHGPIEILHIGFVVATDDFGVKPRGHGVRQPISHDGLNAAMWEAQNNQLRLYLSGDEKRKHGDGTDFRVIITADDVPAFRRVYRVRFDTTRPHHWLMRKAEGANA